MPVFFEINSRVINGHPIANEGLNLAESRSQTISVATLEAWQALFTVYQGATAASFEDWWVASVEISDAEVAELMDGVYKLGVVGVEAMPGQCLGAGSCVIATVE